MQRRVTPCDVSSPAHIEESGQQERWGEKRLLQPAPSAADATEVRCAGRSSPRRSSADGTATGADQEHDLPLASKLFDSIDMNSNGQVSPDELADFVSTLLWANDDVNILHVVQLLRLLATQMLTAGQEGGCKAQDLSEDQDQSQDHSKDQSQDHSQGQGQGQGQGQAQAKDYFTSEDMPALLKALSGSRELSRRLAHTDLLANTFLLRQFINMEYEEKVSVLSWREFLLANVCMQVLPVTLFFASRQKKWAYRSRLQTVVHNVNQLFTHRLLYICSKLPLVNRLGDSVLQSLLPFVSLTYACIYASMVSWWFMYGPYVHSQARTAADFITFLDPASDVGVFEAHLPWLMLQLLILGGTCKVAIKDVDGVDKHSRVVGELGDLNMPLDGDYAACGKDGRRWTSGALLVEVQKRVCDAKQCSVYLRALEASAFVVPLVLTAANRVLRILLVGNFWSTGTAAGPFVALTNVIFNTVLLAVWWQEVMEIVRFLTDQRIRAEVFSKLFSTGEARAARLPCLKRQCPQDLILWAKLRYYIQQPNAVEMRWIELFVAAVLLFALAGCALVLVTLFQGTLLRHSARSGDVQALSLFVALISICLVMFILNNIFTAVSIGNVYREDLHRLAKEVFDAQCWMTQISARSPSSRGVGILPSDDADAHPLTPGERQPQRCSDSDNSRSLPRCGYRTALPVMTRMTSTQDLRDYISVLEKLITLLQMSSEYIELFGVPIDARLRNTILSVFVTAALAVLSSVAGLIIRQVQSD